jgi:preprotein translocase subunit SecA
MLVQPLRRLPDQTKAQIEAAFVDAYRLFRDRQLMLRAVDGLWVRHLTNLEALREGIGLRAYGQQNPLVAYRKEAHEMYEALLARVQETVARSVYLVPQALVTQPRRQRLQATHPGTLAEGRRVRQVQDTPDQALGRNDPCWCGSGKKYKHCHMRQDMESQRGPVTAARPPQAPEQKRRRRRH